MGLLTCLQMAVAQKQRLGGLRPVREPVKPPVVATGDPTDLGGISVTPDEAVKTRLQGKIKLVQDNIAVEDWKTAFEALQELLSLPDDVTVVVERKNPVTGEITRSFVGVSEEAGRMIAALTAKGAEFYRAQVGPDAASELKSAEGDPKLLARIMQRYLYTEAGAAATEQLATHLLDRGQYSTAALCFEKLFQRSGPEKLEPKTLFKAAVAFHRVGAKSNEEKAWKYLEAKAGGNLELAEGKVYALATLKEWVDKRKSVAANRERYDWPVPFGDASHSAQAIGTTAFLEPLWKHKFIKENNTETEFLAKALEFLDKKRLPHLHSFSPIAATFTSPEGIKVPLMVYRTFWGIEARVVRAIKLNKDEDFKAGDLYWDAPSEWSVDRMLLNNQRVGPLKQWMQMYQGSNIKPEIILENSVTGSLTTDNVRVYVVDDFTVPPFHQNNPYGRPGNVGGFEEKLHDAINHSRLQAFELDSGKLLWEAGGKSKGAKAEGLEDTFFMSPPLPLNGKLYVLGETNQEIRLLCLDSATGKLLTKPKRLADAREKILVDIDRRLHASHLAYGEGFLVCPTNSGGILAVDLLNNIRVWAYGYREKGGTAALPQGDPRFGPAPPGFMYTSDGRLVPVPHIGSHWTSTPPIITQGKVVFSAPDARAVHCLNLRDGTRIWKNMRLDGDVYLAGVFAGKVVVVGKSYVRLLNLEDGTEFRRLETGIPSGIGIASKDIYYLPISKDPKTAQPGICLIDLNAGRILATTQSRKQEVPGSLLFYEGDVLSQTLTHVAVYPQLDVELARIDKLLAKNENDPEGRARRGDLRLDKGDLAGAVQDLQVALKQEDKLSGDISAKAKVKLYESLTEYFQADFSNAEKYLDEYWALCSKLVRDNMSESEKTAARAEEKRRKASYYCLLGKGREGQAVQLEKAGKAADAQKRLIEAFDAYMNFGTLGSTEQELLSVVDDPGVKASPSVWSRGRIIAMLAHVSKETRTPLEERIAQRWQKAKESKELEAMRGFVSTFGSFGAVGREARLEFADRLMNDNDTGSLVEAERHLGMLRLQQEDVQMAARAVEALARLMTRKNLMEDATHYYRVLGRDYPKVVIKDGKTGQDFYNDLATDKRLLPFLDEPAPLFNARIESPNVKEEGGSSYSPLFFKLDQEGERLPYFHRYELGLSPDIMKFRVLDRETEVEQWTHQLTTVQYLANLARGNDPERQMRGMFSPGFSPRMTFKNLGHLVLVQVGHMVFAFDPVNKKPLWEKNLAGSSALSNYTSLTVDPIDGSTRVTFNDGWTQRLGQTGPLSPVAVCMLTADSLVAVDPVSGQVLWTRSDVFKKAYLFNDNEYVFVVEVGDDGTAGGTHVFRLQDGVAIRAKDFSALYQKRIRMDGRKLLAADSGPRGVTLQLYDIVEGKELWKHTFAANAQVLRPEAEGFGGVVEPDGKVTLVNLKTLETFALKDGIRPEHLNKLVSLHLLKDRKFWYIACNAQPDQDIVANMMMVNLMPGTGMRSLPVNGELYSFERQTGELNWIANASNQMIVMDNFAELPIVQLTSRYQKWMDKFRGSSQQIVAIKSFDKRTGKLLFEREDASNRYQQFHSLKIDVRGRKVELISAAQKLVHYFDGSPSIGKEGGGKEGSKSGAGSSPSGDSSAVPGSGPGAGPQPPPLPRFQRKLQGRVEGRLRPAVVLTK
jgi:outer membrane protein assembly factor BamB